MTEDICAPKTAQGCGLARSPDDRVKIRVIDRTALIGHILSVVSAFKDLGALDGMELNI